MKITSIGNHNYPSQSDSVNFQARTLIVNALQGGKVTILPKNIGKVCNKFDLVGGGETYWVGILKKGNRSCRYCGDFLVFQQAIERGRAKLLEGRLNDAVKKALTTYGEPIHLDINYEEIKA